MAENTPDRPRRRLSTDTMSTVDIPAPPYGLVDVTQRPGSVLDVPVSSGRGETAPLFRSGYRIRVGKLEIRGPSIWSTLIAEYQLLEVGPVDHIHSPHMTVIIAGFENAIRLGHTLLILLWPFYEYQRYADVDLLYFRLCSLWELCTIVGATLCNRENVLPRNSREDLSEKMSWICEHLLANAIEKVQQMSIPTGTDATSNVRPTPSAAQLEAVERLAREIKREQGPQLDLMIKDLMSVNFRFQLEKFED